MTRQLSFKLGARVFRQAAGWFVGCVQVLASYGHVRDLLNKPGAVDPAADFNLVWAVSGAAGRAGRRGRRSTAAGGPQLDASFVLEYSQ